MISHNSFSTKVLILDDNLLAREGILHTVKRLGEGVKCSTAHTFDEAFESLEQARKDGHPYVFLIADLALDDKNVSKGIEWVRKVKEEISGIKIIAVSGKDTSALPVIEAGVFAFFRKPHYEDLIEIIRYSTEFDRLEKAFLDQTSDHPFEELAFFKDIVEELPVGISVVDRRMRVLYINRHQKKLSGIDDFKEGLLCYEIFANGAIGTCPDCPVVRLIEGNGRSSPGVHMRPRGYHEIIAFPLMEKDGKVLAAVKVAVDVTNREEFANFRKALSGDLKLGLRISMVIRAIMSRGYKRVRMLLTDDGQFIESYQVKNDHLDDFEGYLEPVAKFPQVEEVLRAGETKVFEQSCKSENPCWQQTEKNCPLPEGHQYGLMPIQNTNKVIGAIYVDNYEPPFHDPDITRTPLLIEPSRLKELKNFADESAKAIVESKSINLVIQNIDLYRMDREVFEQQMEGQQLFQTFLDKCIAIIQNQFSNRVVIRNIPPIYGHVMIAEGDWLVRKTWSGQLLHDFGRNWDLKRDSKAFCVKAFIENQEICFNNLEKEPSWKEFLDMLGKMVDISQGSIDEIRKIRSFVCIPLRVSDKVVGTLSLQSEVTNLFNEITLNLIRAFVQRTSQAVKNYLSMKRIKRFPEISEAMAKAKALFNENDNELSIFALLTCFTHGQGMGFNRAVYLTKENNEFFKSIYAIGPKDRIEGERMYYRFFDKGTPGLDEVLGGEIYFDPVPDGLPILHVQDLPTKVQQCKRGESHLPDDVFKALDVQEIVFFPMSCEKKLEAAVLLDNFVTGAEVTTEKLDILRTIAMDYATLLKNQAMLRRMEKEEDRKKGELLHVLTHRLKTDISGPHLWIKSAIKEGKELDQAKLSVIDKKLWTAFTAVNDVLRFSVIESNNLKKHAHFTAVDLKALLNNSIGEVSTLAPERLIYRPPEGIKIRGDSDMLRHAIVNLLDNAFLYSKEDSVVEIDVQPRYMDTNCVRIAVVNEPKVPIGEDEWQRMFEKFFRGENGRFAKGTGLGLYVVHHIALAHEGRVEASPYNDVKVCFALLIPASN